MRSKKKFLQLHFLLINSQSTIQGLKQTLQTLNLRCNAMTDNGMRKLTAPVRMFKQGLQMLRNIDISGNQLTERGVKYLSSLPVLQIIHLSENKIKNYSLLREQRFYLSSEMEALCRQVFDIETHGWAAPVVQAWTAQAQKPPHKTKKSSFYRSQNNVESKPSPVLPPPPIYSRVLISDSLRPGNTGEHTPRQSSHTSAATLDSTSSTMSGDKPRTLAVVEVQNDPEEEDLMKMYGGYCSSTKRETLSSVLSGCL
ncbi:leucine-rich repeat-containing protein 42-like [Haliotis rufescens]|uniref:leucine-rich repeat-containing protein 42-like n=1 Tax=Haliotis rufescens TaxID=6454 RepID=UPI00201F2751|nr:leucine-rich repeat-containing protein 42-like [Haliotis rufescens]